MDIIEETYRLTGTFPKSEIFGLSSQMRRASVSLASNIAEGAGRGSTKEFAQFIRITIGSLYELETQREAAERVGLMAESDKLGGLLLELRKMIHVFQKRLKN